MKAVSSPHPPDAPLASWSHVTKYYGSGRQARRALDGFDLFLVAGTVTGIAGLNGAGKTTALKILLGLAFPDSGSLVRAASLAEPGRIAYVPEDSAHPPLLSCLEIVSSHAALSSRGPKEAARSLHRVGLGGSLHVPARALSKGMARRLSLATALVTDPRLLVLDEPQSGLDPLGRRDLGVLLAERRDAGAAVLIASHDLAEIERWCDRVVVVHEGRIIAEHRPGPDKSSLADRFFDLIAVTPDVIR